MEDNNNDLTMENHIGYEHVWDATTCDCGSGVHHEDCECSRKDNFDVKMYEADLMLYKSRLNSYYNHNCLMRLFMKKPKRPDIQHYMLT